MLDRINTFFVFALLLITISRRYMSTYIVSFLVQSLLNGHGFNIVTPRLY